MTKGMKVRLLRDASAATRSNTPCAVDVGEGRTGLSPLLACDWQFYYGFDSGCRRVDGRTLSDIIAPREAGGDRLMAVSSWRLAGYA
ncbi:hypothetical protein CH63R_10355 [Colletotrichum higginsianum IMI 349063]|uniref:Uncharacterized protein n=1 Tax=Colletotrichum higginsianum (strain IMI 349063) TaxID=759273 RepID=A0A1B7Y2K0_COLHI|nr:uncharacterized protein CH63R_10355 [Colletotrichum higginsianum IMI 349063]OBR06235.1 hypothetical protein CH63R_10355 [Colletotrichum higginsianum IMI 349063]